MKLKELCTDERPRERLLKQGAASLSNAELLAILLRTGTERKNVIDVAHELLRSADGRLNGIAAMSTDRICGIDGIGPSKAVAIAAAFELGRRASSESIVQDRRTVSSPRTVFRIMLPLLRGLEHEEFWIILLNRANYMIGRERMSSGGISSTVVDTKSILHKAIEKKASGVIMVHNHPSGNAIPGQADIKQTDILKKALMTCEIQLIDHVIIAEDSYYSFADEKLTDEKF